MARGGQQGLLLTALGKGVNLGSDRESEKAAFLASAGLDAARREPLSGDASTRAYERLHRPGGGTLIFMDQPPALESAPCPPEASPAERAAAGYNALARLAAGRVDAFVATAGWLREHGLSAPEIFAADAPRGLAVLEDLGDDLFARLVEAGQDEGPLYDDAIAALKSGDKHRVTAATSLNDASSRSHTVMVVRDLPVPGAWAKIQPPLGPTFLVGGDRSGDRAGLPPLLRVGESCGCTFARLLWMWCQMNTNPATWFGRRWGSRNSAGLCPPGRCRNAGSSWRISSSLLRCISLSSRSLCSARLACSARHCSMACLCWRSINMLPERPEGVEVEGRSICTHNHRAIEGQQRAGGV